tara:strand:- start:4044 stop:5954 length:1911 start_codon:yes stop_codon:yes gene_type:complete
MKIAYKHLLPFIKNSPSIEELSNKLFQLGHEHEIENEIFNMEFTPNRGDCLSLIGLSRDLNIFYDKENYLNFYNYPINDLDIDFINYSEETCPYISFMKIEIDHHVNNYKDYLEKYFSDLNITKKNFFTDISNYVSYELGQPTHCYDESLMHGKISFKEIDSEISFETLLEKKITLKGTNSVFLLNDEVINLAGVVGGKSTSCSQSTRTVIIECAYFNPEKIIGKTVHYDLRSEAAHKFERGVDPMNQENVLRRFAQIVSEHTNIKNIELISINHKKYEQHLIKNDVNKVNQILGTNISCEEMSVMLSKLGFIYGENIKVPSYRSDVRNLNDIAEEIARSIGYDELPVKKMHITNKNKNKNKNNIIEARLKSLLIDNGFYEVINSPFVSDDKEINIRVDNPLDSNREFLRNNITDSLIENLLYNERRQQDTIKIFEISDLYHFNKKLNKKRKIGILCSGRMGDNHEEFSKKIDEKYLIRILKDFINLEKLSFKNFLREDLNSKSTNSIVSLELEISDFNDDVAKYKSIYDFPEHFVQYKPISQFPSTYRDISYAVSNHTKSKDLQSLISDFKSDYLKKVFIFDYFENRKLDIIKIGYRFIFQANDRTLTDSEVNVIIDSIINLSNEIDGIEIPGLN